MKFYFFSIWFQCHAMSCHVLPCHALLLYKIWLSFEMTNFFSVHFQWVFLVRLNLLILSNWRQWMTISCFFKLFKVCIVHVPVDVTNGNSFWKWQNTFIISLLSKIGWRLDHWHEYESIRKIPDKNIIHISFYFCDDWEWICGTNIATNNSVFTNIQHTMMLMMIRITFGTFENQIQTDYYHEVLKLRNICIEYSLKHIIASCGIVID